MLLIAVWALLETLWWFIIVDALLLPLAIRRPERAWRYAIVAIVASSIGILMHAGLTAIAPEASDAIVRSVPLLDDSEIARAGAMLDTSVLYALVQPFSGIPVKAWTLVATSWLYLPLVLFSRAVRMLLVAGIGRWASRFAWLKTWHALAVYVTCVAAAILLL